MRIHLGSSDSYSTTNGRIVTVDELKEIIKSQGFNRYSGGRQDSFGCVCDQSVAGYVFKKVLRIKYSNKEECKNVEKEISPLFDIFHPRLWDGESI